MQVCGGYIVNATTLGTCHGDTFLRLFNSQGDQIAFNDNIPEHQSLCSELTFSLPQVFRCEEYTFHLGCGGIGGYCAGQLDVNITGILDTIVS
jgi:hypothetical protein